MTKFSNLYHIWYIKKQILNLNFYLIIIIYTNEKNKYKFYFFKAFRFYSLSYVIYIYDFYTNWKIIKNIIIEKK